MRYFIFTLFSWLTLSTYANKSASEIFVDLQKVHSLKRVLYLAAHPDDENTRVLAWLSLGEKAETAYLSLTRGDGGQNLIGDEFSEDLGVLRTQELLAARSIDHARQYFSRAVDFGYSKSAEESFEKWGKADILSDVVLVIRQFKPDVIITRFPPDKRAGHGHHTASAMLAIEAFEKAADPDFLPEQVKEFGAWKTTSVYWNTSVWWDKELDEKAKTSPEILAFNIGTYNPLLGQSYNEIGTLARSQHKCQGFGAITEREPRKEYFMHLAGTELKQDFFEQNKLSWDKLVGTEFATTFNQLIENFNFVSPEKNIPQLLVLRQLLERAPTGTFPQIKAEKTAQLDDIIVNCAGLYMEVTATDYAFAKGDSMNLTATFFNRAPVQVELTQVNGQQVAVPLKTNETVVEKIAWTNAKAYSNPYWLEAPFNTLFSVKDPNNLGRAEALPTFTTQVGLKFGNVKINYPIPVIYKWRDPSYGERRRNVISTPAFTANFDQKSVILKPGETRNIKINVHSFVNELKDEIRVNVPKGWTVTPAAIPLELSKKHEEAWIELAITPSAESVRGTMELATATGKPLMALTSIEYDHIPTQAIFKPAIMDCIPIDAQIVPGKIAYIQGAGDAVPQAIEQLGFDVSVFEVADLAELDLTAYQSVVLGIRIYNVHPELANFNTRLFDYVKQGGNLIMQYNTASRSGNTTYGPVPFELSRNRVTEEDAAVTFLDPEHPILTRPNKITAADFDHWVQERGLYFATNWSEQYTPLIAWHDKGEKAQEGGLIVAQYGKGQFVYTGISFFRELPNGVEGAYRLFANLLSYPS